MASAHEGDPAELRIVLIGRSESGKSSIGNAILGQEAFKETTTRESDKQRGNVRGRNISIIDTPGFFNSHLTDEELQQQMMKSLDLAHPGPHVFLLIVNLEKFEEDQRDIMEKIQENFGAQALKFTMVLFIGRDKIPNKHWIDLKSNPKFQNLVRNVRDKYHEINSKSEIKPVDITELLKKIDKVITLNKEQNCKQMFTKSLVKRQEKRERTNEHYNQIKQEKLKLQEALQEKSTTDVEAEKKHVISQMDKNEENEVTSSGVPEEKKNNEEETIKQSVKSLKHTFEHKDKTNTVQKQEKCWKTSETEKLEQKKQQVMTEQQSTQADTDTKGTDLMMEGETGAGQIAIIFENENKSVIFHEAINITKEELKDTCSEVPEEKKNNEDRTVKHEGKTNLVKQEKCETEKLNENKQQVPTEQQSTQADTKDKTPEKCPDLMMEEEPEAGKSTANVETKSVISQEAKHMINEESKDTCSGVPEEKKNNEEDTVKQSVKSWKNTFEHEGKINTVQEKCWKMSEKEKLEQEKQQVMTEQQQSTQPEKKPEKGPDLMIEGESGAGKSTTIIETENKSVASHEAKTTTTEELKDTCSGVSEKKKSNEEDTVKQSVKSLKRTFEHEDKTNTAQKQEKCLKMSKREKLDEKKQQVMMEQLLTQADTKQKTPEKCPDLIMEGEPGAGKSTTNLETENKSFISHEAKQMINEESKDTSSGVPEEKKNKEDETVKLEQEKQQVMEEQQSTQTDTKQKKVEKGPDLMMEGEPGPGKCTTDVETENKSVISNEAIHMISEELKDTCSGVSEENENNEEETVQQSVKSLKFKFEHEVDTNTVQKQKCWKTRKQQVLTELLSKQAVSSCLKHRNRSEFNEHRLSRFQQEKSNDEKEAEKKNKTKEKRHIKHEEGTDLRIVILGKTGAGKSSSGNTILGKKVFKEDLSTESVTKKCQKHQQRVKGRNISVIDTPGLFDTKISEEELKKEIEKCIEMSAPGPHVFLLVVRLDMPYDNEKNTVKWILKNFGEEAEIRTILLFTRGDQIDKPIEEFLKQNTNLRSLVKQCKGVYYAFNNKDKENLYYRSETSQVSELLEKIDQIVKNNLGEYYTDEMYQEVKRKMEEEEERHKLEEMEKLKEEERMRLVNTVRTVVLVAVGLAGAVAGGSALSFAGGGTRAAVITGAVGAIGAVAAGALAGLIPSGAVIGGAVVMGGAALISSEWAVPLLAPIIERVVGVIISKFSVPEKEAK